MTNQGVSTYREFADRVRAAADIVEVVSKHVELRRAGANYKGLCPFHEEKTPSFNVHPGKQIFKCFGCGKGGDVITFVREIERADYGQALEILANQYNLEMPRFSGKGPDEKQIRWRKTLAQVLDEAAVYYEERLAHPDHGRAAREYLERRGVDMETARAFRLGVAPEDWEGLTHHLKRKGFSEQALMDTGLARKRRTGGVYDYLQGRLIFPIQNPRDEVVAFGGRSMDGKEPKYLNTADTELFHKGRELYGLIQAREALTRLHRPAVLVEGYMDVIACHQAGASSESTTVQAAVASMGTALTPEQARLVKRYAQEIVFLYDADEAGVKAVLRGLEVLIAAGLTVRVAQTPPGEDPDSLLRARGPEALGRVIDEARPFFDFLLDQAAARYDLTQPEQKLASLEIFEPALAAITEPLVRDEYLRRLAADGRFDQDEDALRQYFLKRLSRRRPRTTPARKPTTPPSRGADHEPPLPDQAPPIEDADDAVIVPIADGRPAATQTRPALPAAAPAPREIELLHILLEHGDARFPLRERVNPLWLRHPGVRRFAVRILELDDADTDPWDTARALANSPDDDTLLQEALFTSRDHHDENYLVVAEMIALELELDYLRELGRRLNHRVREAWTQRDAAGDWKQAMEEEQKTYRRIADLEMEMKQKPAFRVQY